MNLIRIKRYPLNQLLPEAIRLVLAARAALITVVVENLFAKMARLAEAQKGVADEVRNAQTVYKKDDPPERRQLGLFATPSA